MAVHPRYEEARLHMEGGRYTVALEVLRQMEAADGTSSDIEYGKGICFAALGRPTEARAAIHHLRNGGHVALAQRLSERLQDEDPVRLEPESSETGVRSRAPQSINQHYRNALWLALAAILLLACALVSNWFRNDRPAPPMASVAERGGSATNAGSPQAPPQKAANTSELAGEWVSINYVDNVEQFSAAAAAQTTRRALQGMRCKQDGTIELEWSERPQQWREAWFTWNNGSINHKNGHTRAPYTFKTFNGETLLFLPWLSGDVTDRGQAPGFYVMRRAGGAAKSAGNAAAPNVSPAANSAPTPPPTKTDDALAEYKDLRGRDLRKENMAGRWPMVLTLTFNQNTLWPDADSAPKEYAPAAVLERSKNPGLGVRSLHAQGITGKGVSVAIIDQPLRQDHPEFAGRIAAYRDFGCESNTSMHGPAVASLLVGANCGTAPEAKLYYAAAPSWKGDAAYYAQALDWIISENAKLPANEKIRVVSVSAAPSGSETPFTLNLEQWDLACARANEARLVVLDCTTHHGVVIPSYYDWTDPENPAKCRPGFPGMPGRVMLGKLFVPASPRTTAEELESKGGSNSYIYWGRGGLSWAIPYCAGVLAMGWQVRPELSNQTMLDLLFKSAYKDPSGASMIQPVEFIRLVKAT